MSVIVFSEKNSFSLIMSIDSTSSTNIYRQRPYKTALSQSDHYPYSIMDRQSQLLLNTRSLSVAEESSGDTLADLSSLPHMPAKATNISKRHRRFSELKPPIIQQPQTVSSDRRNSIPQIHFGSLLPNAFRTKKTNNKYATILLWVENADDDNNIFIKTSSFSFEN